jgi:signal transduction histidine kinase
LRQLESALASSAGELPKLVLTGQRDLDRIVDSLNRAGARLAAARSAADALARQVAENERLASLGRVVAGIAHEIRNPIAAMRLKAENAVCRGSRLGAQRPRRANPALGDFIAKPPKFCSALLSGAGFSRDQDGRIAGLSDPQQAWLVAAMASTLAGNFTLVGSAANSENS